MQHTKRTFTIREGRGGEGRRGEVLVKTKTEKNVLTALNCTQLVYSIRMLDTSIETQ